MQRERNLLDKWRLVRAAARDNKRLSSGDIAVLIALCDRYGSKTRPDAPPIAGHALLGTMSGMSRRATIDSTRRLIDAGYIEVVELGKGTKGTTYSLNFARGEAELTSTGDDTSGEAEFTTEVKHSSPLEDASGEAYFTESPPTVAPLQGGLQIEGTTCPAPATDGLTATVGGAGEDKFETLWRAYGYRREKAKAKAEFGKLDPTPEGMALLIASATAWRAAWAAQGKPDAPRKHLHVWLRDECWDEEPPTAYKAKKRKQRQPEAPSVEPANDNSAAPAYHHAPARIPRGRYRAVITDSKVEQDMYATTAALHINVAGTAFTLNVAVESLDLAIQEHGQDQLRSIIGATRTHGVEDTKQLHNIPFDMEVLANGELRFHPIAADAAEVTNA